MAKAKLGKGQSDERFQGGLARAKFLLVSGKASGNKKTPVSPEVQTLRHRLALAREEAGIPSLQLDELAGVGGGRTSRVENGKRLSGLPLDTVIKLAGALGVRPAWLALGEEPMKKPAAPPAPPPSLPPHAGLDPLGDARPAFAKRETDKMQQRTDSGAKRETRK